MKKEIIVPSFRTTVDVFAQHFLILRELKHRIELLLQAYYSQMDKKKTWEQVNEIVKVLDKASRQADGKGKKGLMDAASRVKGIAKPVQEAWSQRNEE